MEKRLARRLAAATAIAVPGAVGLHDAAQAAPLVLTPTPNSTVGGRNVTVFAQFRSPRPVAMARVFLGTTLIRESRFSPATAAGSVNFEWDSTPVPSGAHTLSVKLYDRQGKVISTQAVPVRVSNGGGADTVPPQVAFVSPGTNAEVRGDIVVRIIASDDSGANPYVSLFVDKQLRAVSNSQPYAFPLDTTQMANGPHTLEAWAYDAAENQGTAQPVRFHVNNPGGATTLNEEVNRLGQKAPETEPAAAIDEPAPAVAEPRPLRPTEGLTVLPAVPAAPPRAPVPEPAPIPGQPAPLVVEAPRDAVDAPVEPVVELPAPEPAQPDLGTDDPIVEIPLEQLGVPSAPAGHTAVDARPAVNAAKVEPRKPVPQPGKPQVSPKKDEQKPSPKIAATAAPAPALVAAAPKPAPAVSGPVSKPAPAPPRVVIVRKGETVAGDINVTGRSVKVEGKVAGSVDVDGGTVTLGPSAHVSGSVSVRNGDLTRAESAVVEGGIVASKPAPRAAVAAIPAPKPAAIRNVPAPTAPTARVVRTAPVKPAPKPLAGAAAAPAAVSAKPAALTPAVIRELPQDRLAHGRIVHAVHPGETASSIARKYGVPVKRLLAENHIGRRTRLAVGSELTVPAGLRIAMNGRTVQFDVPPRFLGSLTVVPARQLAEEAGGRVYWDRRTREVRIFGEKTIVLKPGSRTAWVNGRSVTLDAPVELESGRTLVPLRFLVDVLRLQADYDLQSGFVSLRSA